MARLTKSAARNIFYGSGAFFLLAFIALTAHSHYYITTTSTQPVSVSVMRGKQVWEKNACIDCHTILGEGAYFAPELGNVWVRFGGRENPDAARAGLKAWMKAQPTRIPGRRQMPQFNLSEQELNDLIDFLEWTSRVNTQGWQPNNAG